MKKFEFIPTDRFEGVKSSADLMTNAANEVNWDDTDRLHQVRNAVKQAIKILDQNEDNLYAHREYVFHSKEADAFDRLVADIDVDNRIDEIYQIRDKYYKALNTVESKLARDLEENFTKLPLNRVAAIIHLDDKHFGIEVQ